MNKRLVFLEFKDEAEAFLESGGGSGADLENSVFVALSLAVQVVLKQRGIPFQNTLPFFNNHSHARSLEQSEEWLQLVEAHLDMEEVLNKEIVYNIRLLFNYLLWLSEVLAEAVKSHQPGTLCFAPGFLPGDDTRWAVSPGDRFMGVLLDTFAAEQEKKIEKIGQKPVTPGRVSSPAGRGPVFLNRQVKKYVRRFCRGRDVLLIGSGGYGMDKAAERIAAAEGGSFDWLPVVLDFERPVGLWRYTRRLLGMRWRHRSKPGAGTSPAAVPVWALPCDWRQVREREEKTADVLQSLARRIETEWRGRFRYRGMDLAPVILHKLRTGITGHVTGLVRLQSQLDVALEILKPKIVLSPFSTAMFSVLGDLCKKRGIAAILIPHGTLAPPHNRLEEIEWRRLSQGMILSTYPYAAAQTPLAAAHAAYYGASERTFNTGPIIFSRSNAPKGNQIRGELGIPDDFSLVVYAVAQRKRSSVRFHIFETEDENLAAMADLVKAVNRLEKVHLAIKLHPASEFTEQQMRCYLPDSDSLSILHKQPFDHVLAASDLLVSFLSSTVEIALINGVPVVLYDKWQRCCFVKAFDCNRTAPGEWPVDAAYYTNDAGTLGQLLQHALANSAARAGNKDSLHRSYSAHIFEEGEYQPLSHYIDKLMPIL